jgi:hypothetical protein
MASKVSSHSNCNRQGYENAQCKPEGLVNKPADPPHHVSKPVLTIPKKTVPPKSVCKCAKDYVECDCAGAEHDRSSDRNKHRKQLSRPSVFNTNVHDFCGAYCRREACLPTAMHCSQGGTSSHAGSAPAPRVEVVGLPLAAKARSDHHASLHAVLQLVAVPSVRLKYSAFAV